MNRNLVSIVIPCYNAVPWIAESIQSALDQTWADKEIIVIDDGSSDGSLDVIKKFDGRIRWESGPNQGGCLARNRGLALARGEWIQFLDADDLLLPDCIEKKITAQAGPLERICCELDLMQGDATQELPEWWRQPSWSLEYMLGKGSPQTGAPLHRTNEVRQVGGFRAHLPCAQEFDLHLRMAVKLGISFVSNRQVGLLFRPTTGSVSRIAGAVRMITAYSTAILDAWQELKTTPEKAQRYAPLVAETLARCAARLYRNGDKNGAERLAEIAVSLSPAWRNGISRSKVSRLLARCIGFSAFEHMRMAMRRLLRLP
jgi:glycosyltransferase involved in cell wall biosynthesis